MRYAYEDLSEDQFETLVVAICSFLFGPSIQPFAKGKDGGRDARFNGAAEHHPSATKPWVGKSVIQAKHTIGINMHFSDSDFFSATAEHSVLTDEIPNVKKLIADNELDYYMVFSNRKLTAGTEHTIRKYLEKNCGLSEGAVYLAGTEQMELWIRRFRDIPAMASLSAVDGPLIVDVDDLSSVIEALSEQKGSFDHVVDDLPVPRIPYEVKNAANRMSAEYAEVIRKNYLADTPQIRTFLSLPENDHLLKIYEDVVDEFELKIIAKKKNYQSFDDVMNYLMDLLFKRDPILRRNKRLTRMMLFYMYWNCDIGSSLDAEAN